MNQVAFKKCVLGKAFVMDLFSTEVAIQRSREEYIIKDLKNTA